MVTLTVRSGQMTITIDLTGRTALVTGAGAGIGRQIASWLARAGADVVVNDIDADRAAATVAAIVDAGGRATARRGDARDETTMRAVAAAPLDIAVNNVGMMAGRTAAPFTATTPDDARAVIEQNLVATFVSCRAEADAILATGRGGVILNVTSGETTRPAVGLAAYGAAKAAINHLTMTLASELGPQGIRVNAIAPGTTFTEQVEAHMGREQFERISASTPLRRVCEPDELGRLAVFLASDLARCITGQLFLADAGAHLGRLPLSL
jgi:NAD(P)-dependent dehydrogenase (short-subunit alcohol dehydrogenase family)